MGYLYPKRKPEEGRPRGTVKRYPFEQTRLGFMLKYEVPHVYDLILRLTPRPGRSAPPMEIILAVCTASPDPSLRKPKFHRWLAQYAQKGVLCGRAKMPTPERMVFYHNLRRRKLARFVSETEKTAADSIPSDEDF